MGGAWGIQLLCSYNLNFYESQPRHNFTQIKLFFGGFVRLKALKKPTGFPIVANRRSDEICRCNSPNERK